MYQEGHRRVTNQSNWSNASTVQVQKVRGPNILVPPNFQVGARASPPPVPTSVEHRIDQKLFVLHSRGCICHSNDR